MDQAPHARTDKFSDHDQRESHNEPLAQGAKRKQRTMKILTSVDYEEEGRLLRRKLAPLLEARGAGAHLQVAKPEEMAAACDDDVAVAIICTPAFRTVHREAFRVLRFE